MTKAKLEILGLGNTTNGLAEKLEEAIKSATSATLIKPSIVGTVNLTGLALNSLQCWEFDIRGQNLKDPKNSLKPEGRIKKFLEVLEKKQYGVQINNQNDILLYPIDPDTKIKGIGIDTGLLVHKGILINGSNNIENLRKYGVFGNPGIISPTYLMRQGANPTTYGRGREELLVTLFIDKKRLVATRDVFIDPETIEEDPSLKDKLGDSYFVLGGIPGEAIVGFRQRSKEYKIRPYPKPTY